MKIAIIHDWLVVNGGAEKTLKEILNLFPNSDLFSLVNFLDEKDKKEIIGDKPVTTSFIQNLPFAKKYFRYYLPLFPKAIESFDLSDYNVIISSSWAFAKGVKKTNNQLHISYCYTPIRYAWDMYKEYTENLNYLKKFFVKQTLKYIRKWDLENSKKVDYFIAISEFIRERIKRIYNRDSVVIYPPVDTMKFELYEDKEDFYLTVSRLVGYKKTKLIVEAFNKMPDKQLIVIGKGEEYKKIKRIAKANIKVLGYQPYNVVLNYMQRAKGFVYAAIEDFGIVLVEAMACGTPVIALGRGGANEIVNSKVGIKFNNQTVEDIIKAVESFENRRFNYKVIRKESLKYDKENFKKSFLNFIKEKIKNRDAYGD